MTVKELIDKLKTFDSNKKVYLIWDDESPLCGGDEINDIYEINGSKVEECNAVYIERT